MTKLTPWLAATTILAASSLHAAGLDRSGQSSAAIFSDPGTLSLSFGAVNPHVTGSDGLGNSYDVGNSYRQVALSYTGKINDDFNYAIILDQPYGADTFYNATPGTSMLGGTRAKLKSEALGVIGKYKINPRVSVFGGIKAQRVSGEIDLNGQAYAAAIDAQTGGAIPAAAFLAAGGYKFQMDNSTEPNFVIGGAYEIPDIAFRLAVTYSFERKHKADTVEQMAGITRVSTVSYKTPQSLNIDFQTGIAANTLLMASYRWTDFSAVDVVPNLLGSDLVNLDDGHRWTLGVGRRFTDEWSGTVMMSYEPKGDDIVSPLGPTNGLIGLTIGGRYQKDNVTLSGGVNYTKLGDAQAGVGGVGVASFANNHVVGLGFKAEIKF